MHQAEASINLWPVHNHCTKFNIYSIGLLSACNGKEMNSFFVYFWRETLINVLLMEYGILHTNTISLQIWKKVYKLVVCTRILISDTSCVPFVIITLCILGVSNTTRVCCFVVYTLGIFNSFSKFIVRT